MKLKLDLIAECAIWRCARAWKVEDFGVKGDFHVNNIKQRNNIANQKCNRQWAMLK